MGLRRGACENARPMPRSTHASVGVRRKENDMNRMIRVVALVAAAGFALPAIAQLAAAVYNFINARRAGAESSFIGFTFTFIPTGSAQGREIPEWIVTVASLLMLGVALLIVWAVLKWSRPTCKTE